MIINGLKIKQETAIIKNKRYLEVSRKQNTKSQVFQ